MSLVHRTALALCLFGCAPFPSEHATLPATLTSGSATVQPAPSVATVADPAPTMDSVGYDEEASDVPEDGAESNTSFPADIGVKRAYPLEDWTAADFEERLKTDPESLGSISLGRPGAGALLNGVQMPEGEGWSRVDPANCWGTAETVEFITKAIEKVRARFPDSHPVYIGHISAKNGGHLRPHVSHQAGRDVDLSYFYTDESARWYARATVKNLDLPRTWAFVRAFVTDTDPELILIDHSIQKLLRDYALSIGENETWVKSLFDGVPGKLRPLILHAKGHATHLHVRFFNPVAQETARRAHTALAKSKIVPPPVAYVTHRVKKGETLGMLAKKYGTTVSDIKRVNGLRSNLIRWKHEYRIPKKVKAELATPALLAIPARRLPPS
jgi:LysM repeat protein